MNFDVQKIKLKQLPLNSKVMQAYLNNLDEVAQLYDYEPVIDGFNSVIQDKAKDKTDRKLLVDVLLKQYEAVDTSESVKSNINSLLDENTFTICTAHQLNIFTGPLYIILVNLN